MPGSCVSLVLTFPSTSRPSLLKLRTTLFVFLLISMSSNTIKRNIMAGSRLLGLSLLLAGARAAQPGAAKPVAAPMRDLTWGQLNFLHTTDTHGWIGGHLLEYRPQHRSPGPAT